MSNYYSYSDETSVWNRNLVTEVQYNAIAFQVTAPPLISSELPLNWLLSASLNKVSRLVPGFPYRDFRVSMSEIKVSDVVLRVTSAYSSDVALRASRYVIDGSVLIDPATNYVSQVTVNTKLETPDTLILQSAYCSALGVASKLSTLNSYIGDEA
jgi:hypothetical protein